MKILLVAEALRDEARGIGLAGVTEAQRVTALASRLGERGHEIRMLAPLAGLDAEGQSLLRPRADALALPGGLQLTVFTGKIGPIPLYALGHDLPAGAMARAVPGLLNALDWHPDVIHCWGAETGLVPFVFREVLGGPPAYAEMALLVTVQDVSRQRVRPPEILDRLAIDRRLLRLETAEFYGQVNFLKAALTTADAFTLPSERFAQDVQDPTFGEGLEGVFEQVARAGRLWGVADGIDYRHFDPSSDSAIAQPFTLANRVGKAACKSALQAELALEPDDVPLLAVIGELSAAKGMDLLRETMGILSHMGVQVAVLGQGAPEDVGPLRRAFSETRAIRGVIGWDEAQARRVLAGADMILMPARFEPDGFWLKVAMRYGTVPVVYETGALVDAVQEFDPRTGEGTGFRFSRYGGEAMLAALRHAQAVYAQPVAWSRLLVNVMARDWSWEAAAARYEDAYEKALAMRPLRV